MPALITHHLFGEESIERLPAGIIETDEDRMAFILGNQGPDPFFFRARTPSFRSCMKLGHVMHSGRVSRQLAALHAGVGHLPRRDAGCGRAFALGLLSHYVLDRNAHPFVYQQQWGIQETDPDLAQAGGKVHAVIESDLDVLMLQLKRDGATVAEYPPAGELVTSDRVDKIAGVLMSHVAGSVYGLDIASSEYGGAVADMQFIYRTIEPAGAPVNRGLAALEGLAGNYSLLGALAHPVTTQAPEGTGNLGHRAWTDPFTQAVSHESFPEVFGRALDDYARTAALFIEGGDMAAVTGHRNYSGRVLDASEEFFDEE